MPPAGFLRPDAAEQSELRKKADEKLRAKKAKDKVDAAERKLEKLNLSVNELEAFALVALGRALAAPRCAEVAAVASDAARGWFPATS